jgi:general stress protein 26
MHEHDDEQLPVRDLGEVLDGFRFAMVATVVDGTITSRPLTLLEQEGPTLRFLVAASAPWVQAFGTGATVHAAFADTADETYVAVEGIGRITDDRDTIDRLWNPAASAFFEGPDDPEVRALEVVATGGEWWDGPSSRIGQAFSLLRTKLGGSTPEEEHGAINPTS